MKRILLLLMTLVLAVSGIKAAPSISKNGTTITLSGFNAGDLAKVFAGEIEGIRASDFSGVSKIVFGSGCALNADDFTAMSSTTHSELSGVKTVDMSNATVSVDTSEGSTATAISTMKDMNLANMEYLRLPSSFDNAPDMKALRSASKNAKLKMVMSTDESDDQRKKVRMYSFEKNNVVAASTALGVNLKQMKMVDMAGYYGENDLYNNGNSANFGEQGAAPAAWDFTGANFAECTISGTVQTDSYYSYDDQFEEGNKSSIGSNYQTNSFFYFNKNNNYTDATASIKLPDVDMAQLPARCLYSLGAKNKNNYLLIHPELTEAQISELFPANSNKTFAPIDQLVIPNCYTLLDKECALEAHIKSLLIGNGDGEEIIVEGGAFRQCKELEDLDFVSGISECWLGDKAFNECDNMKHIALAEGIVSLGAGCFYNSQHLESIRLPESLVYMGNACFDNCLALSSMTIPSNVEKIGKKAFKLCPITDFYLTTTDPEKIPEVWSLGTAYGSFDSNCTFYNSHLWGWQTINGVDEEKDKQFLATMTWDQATDWYFALVSGMAVLHYPEELAEKVRASISDTYSAESSDHVKLPMWQDVSKRDNIPGADLGSSGSGTWTKDGWAQFLLMKGYQPGEEDIVYTKEYSDVWYTMCFPFDLTDEQLAAAFNETFNIADFSGVELKAKTDTDPMKLILHFDKVAVTYYKDVYGKIYHRLCKNGTSAADIYWGEPDQVLWREQHGTFSYNVYIDDEGNIYHHVHPKGHNLDKNKTKTFAIGNAAGQNEDNAILIDGILAEAGHPYMIHPAIGVNPGQPKKACNMAGITWKVSPDETQQSTDDYRDELFTNMARTVDLGHTSTKDENRHNYYQSAYRSFGEDHKDYNGQKYTFIGNAREFVKGATPTTKPVLTAVEPKAPKGAPTPVEAPAVVDDPGITVTDQDVSLYSVLTEGGGQAWNRGPWFGETEEITDENRDRYWNSFNSMYHIIQSTMVSLGYGYNPTEAGFNHCKEVFNNCLKVLPYRNYLEQKKRYDKYIQEKDYYDAWMEDNGETLKNQYKAAVKEYEDAIAAWKEENKGKFIVIPEYAYFLGTKTGEIYPKYFRERSNDQNRSTGLWTQYTAIVVPNDEAIAGVEKDLDAKTQVASGSKIAFNEPFFFIDDTPQGIATLIEKIEKEEGKAPEVEYMDIVVSIDGKIVSRDKTTFEGLPKGVYIINGKKYYVK